MCFAWSVSLFTFLGLFCFLCCSNKLDPNLLFCVGEKHAPLDDEDISTNVTPTSSPTTHTGPVTRARARQMNYQVLSFLANPSNVHEHMMLPKLDTFVLLRNEGPSMDKKDGHWSGIKHGDGGARAGKDNGASSGDFRTLKPP